MALEPVRPGNAIVLSSWKIRVKLPAQLAHILRIETAVGLLRMDRTKIPVLAGWKAPVEHPRVTWSDIPEAVNGIPGQKYKGSGSRAVRLSRDEQFIFTFENKETFVLAGVKMRGRSFARLMRGKNDRRRVLTFLTAQEYVHMQPKRVNDFPFIGMHDLGVRHFDLSISPVVIARTPSCAFG
ncbi:MAG TPA: hypothetical protein VIM69_08460 [Opitutaceae bacterium]|jgi:hypothetical protein